MRDGRCVSARTSFQAAPHFQPNFTACRCVKSCEQALVRPALKAQAPVGGPRAFRQKYCSSIGGWLHGTGRRYTRVLQSVCRRLQLAARRPAGDTIEPRHNHAGAYPGVYFPTSPHKAFSWTSIDATSISVTYLPYLLRIAIQRFHRHHHAYSRMRSAPASKVDSNRDLLERRL